MSAVERTDAPIGRDAAGLGWRARLVVGSPAEAGIWAISVAMLLGAIALLTVGGVGAQRAPLAAPSVPLWALLPAVAVSEWIVVHIPFRRSAHSMSLGEIPLVFGLAFAGGWTAAVAYAVGRLLVLAVVRRLPAIRLAFNLGLFLLGGAAALLVFHSVARPATALDGRICLAAAAAAATASIVAVLMISVAVSLTEGQLSLRRVWMSLATGLAVAATNTAIGLCAARYVHRDWPIEVLLAVPVLGMIVAMRAYATERRRHGRLEFLYETARELSRSAEITDALQDLLGRCVETFRAEVAEIVVFSPDGVDGLRITVAAGSGASGVRPLGPTAALRLRALLERQRRDVCPTREVEVDDPEHVADLEARGLAGGMFAVLRGERSCVGAMMIGDPSSVVDAFDEIDLRLLHTLAVNVSVAMENDRLGRTVWQMRKLQDELEHQASHDPLTNLANRVLFTERVADALGSADGGDRRLHEAAVIFIDVNDFKTVNDSLGHAAGDELLRAIAARLGDCVRTADTLARLGGDEFAILVGGTGAEDAAIDIAGRIDERMSEHLTIAGQSISVRVSAGIASASGGPITPDELIRNADLAMYRAKSGSSQGYELFETGMEAPVRRRHRMSQRLRDAIADDRFLVHYQPVVELESGHVSAREALIRWTDGPRGVIAPATFIPIAEELGMIVPIGRMVLDRACHDAQRWAPAGRGAPAVHVNLSLVELRDERFPDGVAQALAHSGLAPERLVLEITESAMIDDPERSLRTLGELRELGVRLALDDFGTGYSSLSHLRRLPLDWVKVGEPFTEDIGSGGANRPFMRMILELADSLGLGVVAEGIETADQMRSLREMGCAHGQGYLLGAPGPLEPTTHGLTRS